MTEPEFDVTFADLEYELWALDEHLQALEGQIAFFQHPDRKKTYQHLGEKGFTQDEVQTVLDVHHHRVDRILPRVLRGSYLIALWAVFEAGALEVAEVLGKKRKAKHRVTARPASTFVQRLEVHFRTDLKLPLGLSSDCQGQLADLLDVRDAFAHANGRTEAVRPDRLQRISRLASSGLVADEDGFLIPSAAFLKQSHGAVKEAVQALLKVYEQAA